jgi:hypothetical protein
MPDQPNRVAVIDVDMPFLSMVRFMVKWAIASIPALVILIVVGALVATISFGALSGLGGRRDVPTSTARNPYLEKLPGR